MKNIYNYSLQYKVVAFRQPSLAQRQSASLRCLDSASTETLKTFASQLKEIYASLYLNRYKKPIPRVFISYPWGVLRDENWVRNQLDSHLEFMLGEENVILDEKDNRTNDIARFIDLMNKAKRVILVITPLTLEKYERGTISEKLFAEIGLREGEREALLADLRKAGLIDQLGYLIWQADMELIVQNTVQGLNLPAYLTRYKPKIIEKLIEICSLYRNGNAAVISQEISILNNARARDFKQRGSVILALLEGTARDMPPLLQSLPVVFFNAGQFTKTDLSFLYPDQNTLENQWQMLIEKKCIDPDGNEARPTRIFTDKLSEGRAELIAEIGPVLVEFLATVPERYYAWNFLRLAENLNISSFGQAEIEGIKRSMQKVVREEIKQVSTEYQQTCDRKFLPVNSSSLPKTIPPEPKDLYIDTDIKLPDYWIPRQKDEAGLRECLLAENNRIIEIARLGGSGKSSFVRCFIKKLQSYGLEYKTKIWFSFYHQRHYQAAAIPFNKFLNFVIEELGLFPKSKDTAARRRCLEHYLSINKTLIVLDGLEIAQGYKNDGVSGNLLDAEFRNFLTRVTNIDKGNIIITTRAPLTDFENTRGYFRFNGLKNEDLEYEDIKNYFIKDPEIKGDEGKIRAIFDNLGGHMLSLAVFKGFLKEEHNGDLEKINEILEFINAEIRAEAAEDDQEEHLKQCQKIRRIIMKIKESPREDITYFMEHLSLLFGEITEENYDLLLPEALIRKKARIIKRLKRLNLLVEGECGGKQTLTAHPIVKRGFYELMEKGGKMAVHLKLLAYFQSRPRPRQLQAPDEFNNLMEWSHQLTKVLTLRNQLEQYHESKSQIARTDIYRRIKQLMTNLITERSIEYLRLQAEGFQRSVAREEEKKETLRAIKYHRENDGGLIRSTRTISVSAEEKKQKSKEQSLDNLINEAKNINERFENDFTIFRNWQNNLELAIKGIKIQKQLDQLKTSLEVDLNIEQIMEALADNILLTAFYSLYLKTITSKSITEQIQELMADRYLGPEALLRAWGARNITGIPEIPAALTPEIIQKAGENHILVCVPDKIMGRDPSIMSLKNQLWKQAESQHQKEKFYNINWYHNKRFATEKIKAGWYLIRTDVPAETRNKTYQKQEAAIRQYKAEGYKTLEVGLAVFGMLMYNLQTGRNDMLNWRNNNAAWCKEQSGGGVRVGVGFDGGGGLYVDDGSDGDHNYDFLGRGLLRNF